MAEGCMSGQFSLWDFFLVMAVTLAGHGLDPCFGWTSGRRRSLAGTEVVAVPESRPASLGNYCSLLTYNKVMVESLEEASVRDSPRNHSFFGHSLSFLWHQRIPWPRLVMLPCWSSIFSPSRKSAMRFVMPGAADPENDGWRVLYGFTQNSNGIKDLIGQLA